MGSGDEPAIATRKSSWPSQVLAPKANLPWQQKKGVFGRVAADTVDT